MSVNVVVVDTIRVVSSLVFRQMITSHELLSAMITRETLLASVRTTMTLKFVASRESLHTVLPVASERLVSSVSTEMSSQMRRFSIRLLTQMTNVNSRFSVALPRILYTIRTGAGASLGSLSAESRRVHIVVRRHVHHRIVRHLMLLLHLSASLWSMHRWIPSRLSRRCRWSLVGDDPFLWVVGILLKV